MVKKVKEVENKKTVTEPPKKVIVPNVPLPTYGTLEEMDFNDVYDEGDLASAIEMAAIAQALSHHKHKVAPETHPDFDGESCVDCGNEIPQVRLDMHRVRCFDCQNKLEVRNKMFGKK